MANGGAAWRHCAGGIAATSSEFWIFPQYYPSLTDNKSSVTSVTFVRMHGYGLVQSYLNMVCFVTQFSICLILIVFLFFNLKHFGYVGQEWLSVGTGQFYACNQTCVPNENGGVNPEPPASERSQFLWALLDSRPVQPPSCVTSALCRV